SQRVKIVEKDNGNVTSTKQFVWVLGDAQPSEERDGSNTVTKRYYAQGVQIGTTNYYYTRDHLGSVRELTDNSAAVQTRYDYDPYGRRTKVSGSLDADFGFTGHYVSSQYSDLAFTPFRIYSTDLGRWISRDPIREVGGINLYAYVGNDPINRNDPLGLCSVWGLPPLGRSAWTIYDEALKDAQKRFPRQDLWNGPGDAYRHCLASCMLAREDGSLTAILFGWANEERGDWFHNQERGERAMDDFNN